MQAHQNNLSELNKENRELEEAVARLSVEDKERLQAQKAHQVEKLANFYRDHSIPLPKLKIARSE